MSVPPSSVAPTLPTTGDVIDGKYVLERLLGRGGMGAVYAARHRKLGHAVAIKVMLADAANHEAASRFVNEGRAAANIQNEHVVRVSDVDEENGYAYMVLELLEGEDLAQVLERERRLAAGVVVSYAMQALAGVRQAHAQGIVHRDLKPSNLFLAKRQDGTGVIKVLDFGISKANSANPLGAAPGALTSTKAMLGSPLYMSPEQLRSSKSVDARADIWAMGVIIYELCTGKLPFMGDNLGELFAQILEVEAPPLRQLAPDAPPQLEAIVAKCLQRRPENRFQSAIELERELAPLLNLAGTAQLPYPSGQSPAAHTAMMSTPQNGYVQPPRHPSGQYDPRLAPPQHMQMTPQGGMMGPPPGTYPGAQPRMVTTGSGAHPPVVKGTVPLGASTPQPNALTDGSWQNTGNVAGVPSKTSTTLLVVAVCGVLAVVGVGFGVYSITHKHPATATTDPPASASTGLVATAPTVTAAPTASTMASAAPSASASAPASASAAASADKPTNVQVAIHPQVPNGRPNTKPETKPADPPPVHVDPPPRPTATAKPDPGIQQNSR